MLYAIIIVVFIISFITGYLYFQTSAQKEYEYAQKTSKKIVEHAQQEYEHSILSSKEKAGRLLREEKEKLIKEKKSAEEEIHNYELQLEKESQKINSVKSEYSQKDKRINEGYIKLKETYEKIKTLKYEKRQILNQEIETIEKVAKISSEDLKKEIYNKIISSIKKESKAVLMSYEDIPETDFIPQAKRIIGISLGRMQHTKIQEKHFSSIILSPLQYENLLNIGGGTLKNLEEILHLPISMFEDENKKINIKFDSIDAVNKEIARRVIEKLPKRIKTIEEFIKFKDKKTSEMNNELIGFGRKAFREVGLKITEAPEIIELLGRLYYRTSYTQNQWLHSVEASKIAGLMASELGLDVALAKKAALLHDIGKALTHEKEGSHAVIGANEARKYNVDDLIINAMESHHGDVPIKSMYSRLVMAADALSGGRPGARRELMETYFDRIRNLEKLVTQFKGVYEVQAVQAGRELRIVVDNSIINDNKTEVLAQNIANKISEDLVFPGQIKVTVIRNFKSVEYAK